MASTSFLITLSALFLFTVLELAVRVKAVKTPRVDSQAMNLTYKIGTNAELRCTVADLGRNTVIWRRLSDPVPISVGTVKFTPSKKYRVAHDKSTNTWTLFIKKLGHDDAGEYECRVTGADGASKTLSLIMPGRHHTYIEPTNSILEVDRGQDVLLPCKVNNLKKHKVLWVKERGELLSFRKRIYSGDSRMRMVHPTREEWSLRIRKVQDADFGTYTCLVNTDPVLTRTITLRSSGPASSPPVFISDKHIRHVSVKEGNPATLSCNFRGYPEPKITWSARVLVGNKKVKKSFKTVGPTFKLDSVRPEDSGNYTCTARNGISPVARGKVRLYVEAKPTTPAPKTTPSEPTGPTPPVVYTETEEVGERKGRNAILVCHSVGSPGPTMYWKWRGNTLGNSYKYRIKTSEHGQHRRRSELRITHVVREDFGEYECYAHNNRGHSGSRVRLIETFD